VLCTEDEGVMEVSENWIVFSLAPSDNVFTFAINSPLWSRFSPSFTSSSLTCVQSFSKMICADFGFESISIVFVYILYPPLIYQTCFSVSVLPNVPVLCIFVIEGTLEPITLESIEEFFNEMLPTDIDSSVVLKMFEYV